MMLVRAVAAAVAAALVLGMLVPRADAGAAPAAAAAAAAQVHGIALGLFSEDAGWSYRPLLDEIAAAGADHVELVVPWYQTDAAATVIVDHPRFSPTPAAIVAAIRDARAAGLAVTLFPIVRLSAPRTPDEWRGTLAPPDHAAWAAAVAALRRVFHGALMYSGNWDHYRDVAVYDLVDIVGLCAYFALVEPGAPATVDDLTRGWRDMRVELERFFAGRPIVFTELGYRSIHGSSASPWDEGSAGTVDLDEQRRCYAAFRRVWKSAPPDRFGGVYYWNWYGWGGPTSTGYTPRGKPALNELRAFFR